MTFVDIAIGTKSVAEKNNVIKGRIDRCGFDSGGESGARYVFTLAGSSKVHMLNPRYSHFEDSRAHIENTLALTKPGDDVSLVVSRTGLVMGFDNISAGRTITAKTAGEPNLTTGMLYLMGTGGLIVLVVAMVISGVWAMSDTMSKAQLRGQVSQLVNGAQSIAGAAVIYKVDHSGAAARSIAELLPHGDAGGYLTRMPEGWPGLQGESWRIVDGRGGQIALTPIVPSEAPEICAEVERQADGRGQFRCTDSEGLASTAASATDFAYDLDR